jgi:hypothetical protein
VLFRQFQHEIEVAGGLAVAFGEMLQMTISRQNKVKGFQRLIRQLF